MNYDIVTFSDNLKSNDNYQNHTTSKMYQSLTQVRADISTLLCIHKNHVNTRVTYFHSGI